MHFSFLEHTRACPLMMCPHFFCAHELSFEHCGRTWDNCSREQLLNDGNHSGARHPAAVAQVQRLCQQLHLPRVTPVSQVIPCRSRPYEAAQPAATCRVLPGPALCSASACPVHPSMCLTTSSTHTQSRTGTPTLSMHSSTARHPHARHADNTTHFTHWTHLQHENRESQPSRWCVGGAPATR